MPANQQEQGGGGGRVGGEVGVVDGGEDVEEEGGGVEGEEFENFIGSEEKTEAFKYLKFIKV